MSLRKTHTWLPCIPPDETKMECYRAPPPSPIFPPQSGPQRNDPCPSPYCAMLSVDQQIETLVMNSGSACVSNINPAPSPVPVPEANRKRQALSLDASPSPSPLHQVSSAEDEDDSTTTAASIPPSSCFSDTDTLFNAAPTKTRVTSWFRKARERRQLSISSPLAFEAGPHSPSSPTLSESSSTPLCPTPLMNRLPVSSPITHSSTVNATIRSSVSDIPIRTPQPTFQSTKGKSWPGRRRPLTVVSEDEKTMDDVADPQSGFSDSEDEGDGHPGGRKGFRRRLSDTFGVCFKGRKH